MNWFLMQGEVALRTDFEWLDLNRWVLCVYLYVYLYLYVKHKHDWVCWYSWAGDEPHFLTLIVPQMVTLRMSKTILYWLY